MAGTVALLLKATPQQNASKPAKPARGDEAGDEFKAELGRAKRRQANEPHDQNDDTKKADKASPTKKANAKGKSKKPDDHEADPNVTAETHSSDPHHRKAEPTSTADDSAEDVASDTLAESDSSAEATKSEDQSSSTDPNAAVLNIALPVQTSTAEAAKTELSDEQGSATVVKAVGLNESQATAALTEQAASDADSDQPAAAQSAGGQVSAEQLAADQAAQNSNPTDGKTVKPQAADASVDALGEDSKVAIQPKVSRAKSPETGANIEAAPAEAALSQVSGDLPEADAVKSHADKSTDSGPAIAVSPDLSNKLPTAAANQVTKADQPQLPPEARFAEANHSEIVKGIQTELMPRGGTMQIRLDPPELGALQVILTVKDGVMNATFQTSSDDSSRLLSHSLGQLKTALESAGVTVDKLQVTHAPRDTQTNTGGDDQRHQPGQDDMSRQQEQQRKEMIKRMWRKLAGESDPLDLVA